MERSRSDSLYEDYEVFGNWLIAFVHCKISENAFDNVHEHSHADLNNARSNSNNIYCSQFPQKLLSIFS